ncbi:hypothetical protein [Curtobacterium sp. CFBP9011]|uniref:hypothetical protein n=1 Tax=Curtobacterium sp. CFBP9011 TaxID=3096530 RepID=UPI002A6B7F57|nr:hypothetical protein [Curtobacterium sp. CFBP9011]MDY1005754.1 hypothetical protein [Curtobacterium sp. CFBP9011]
MAWFPIGPSSYPDLFGQMQFVNSERIAQQWLSLTRDFAARFGQNGDRLTPNEGRRTKERCEYLYAKYLRDGYPVAAALYLSRHYEGTHGNAIDAGVTMANGRNRALTAEEFAWLHEQCELRGFTWTGRNFGEPWHIEGATRTEHFPPYPGITVENAVLSPEEDDMNNEQDARLKRLEGTVDRLTDLVSGLHSMVSDDKRGISTRVAATLKNTDYLVKEFTNPKRGVITRLQELLGRVTTTEKQVVPEGSRYVQPKAGA